jgi:hypothetical protein
MQQLEAVVKYVCKMNQWPSWKVPKTSVWNAINSAGLS